MRRSMSTILLLAICPLLAAQQPQSVAEPQAAPQTQPAPAPSAAPQSAAATAPHALLDGTPVKLRLSETISSADTKVG